MRFKFVAAALATATLAQPAFAQDAAPAVDGPRVEARVGFDRVRIKSSFDDGVDAVSDAAHEDGVAFGAEFGFDRTIGNGLVLGAYAGVDLSTTDYCSEVYGGDEGCLDAGRNITLGVRAGANLSRRTSLAMQRVAFPTAVSPRAMMMALTASSWPKTATVFILGLAWRLGSSPMPM